MPIFPSSGFPPSCGGGDPQGLTAPPAAADWTLSAGSMTDAVGGGVVWTVAAATDKTARISAPGIVGVIARIRAAPFGPYFDRWQVGLGKSGTNEWCAMGGFNPNHTWGLYGNAGGFTGSAFDFTARSSAYFYWAKVQIIASVIHFYESIDGTTWNEVGATVGMGTALPNGADQYCLVGYNSNAGTSQLWCDSIVAF